MPVATKTLTVRLPLDLYETSHELAQRRKISLNALMQESLTAMLKAEEYARLYEAFGRLGEDAEESDVEFAAHAQWEVVNRGEL
jgi:predicted transcriptional regulator